MKTEIKYGTTNDKILSVRSMGTPNKYVQVQTIWFNGCFDSEEGENHTQTLKRHAAELKEKIEKEQVRLNRLNAIIGAIS